VAPPVAAATSVRVAFAAGSVSDPPALRWLRNDVLSRLPEWPAEQNADAAFTLHCEPDRLRLGAPVALPAGIVSAGEARLSDGASIRFACETDGREEWYIESASPPHQLRTVLSALHVEVDGPPRTVDLGTLVGHLSGPAVHGDPTAEMLSIGAAHCGEITFAVRRTGQRLLVCGRSLGGLTLPAVLTWLSLQRDATVLPADAVDLWRLRAFGARDGDRAEAARQLQRGGGDGIAGLRAMLHADEPGRLAAIDGLMRMCAVSELPLIVAAADEDLPLVTSMVVDALRQMWPLASEQTRDAARGAMSRHPTLAKMLESKPRPPNDGRFRHIGILSVLASGLLGLLLRERRRRFG